MFANTFCLPKIAYNSMTMAVCKLERGEKGGGRVDILAVTVGENNSRSFHFVNLRALQPS